LNSCAREADAAAPATSAGAPPSPPPPPPHTGPPAADGAPLTPARRDLALDLVARTYPRDTALGLRARDRASFRDPNLSLIAGIVFPRLLLRAALCGDARTVRALLASPRIDPNCDKSAALNSAADQGWGEVVDALLADSRVRPSGAALLPALRNGHGGIGERILASPRLELSPDEWTSAVDWAASRGERALFERLPALAARLDGEGGKAAARAFAIAADWRHAELAAWLLARWEAGTGAPDVGLRNLLAFALATAAATGDAAGFAR
jgi:hypothetical protein